MGIEGSLGTRTGPQNQMICGWGVLCACFWVIWLRVYPTQGLQTEQWQYVVGRKEKSCGLNTFVFCPSTGRQLLKPENIFPQLRCCHSPSAKPAGNQYHIKGYPRNQNKTNTLHFIKQLISFMLYVHMNCNLPYCTLPYCNHSAALVIFLMHFLVVLLKTLTKFIYFYKQMTT